MVCYSLTVLQLVGFCKSSRRPTPKPLTSSSTNDTGTAHFSSVFFSVLNWNLQETESARVFVPLRVHHDFIPDGKQPKNDFSGAKYVHERRAPEDKSEEVEPEFLSQSELLSALHQTSEREVLPRHFPLFLHPALCLLAALHPPT